MSLNNPDSRRALRSIIQAVVALAICAYIGWAIHFLREHPPELYGVAIGCLIIVGLGTLLYGAENITRAIKFKGPLGIEGGVDGEATPVKVVNAPDHPVPVETGDDA